MINKYNALQWSNFDGCTVEEVYEDYGNDVVAFYAMDESAVAGVEHADGTFDIFGAGMDENNVTYEEMISAIKSGM